jgi:hypothetical protein
MTREEAYRWLSEQMAVPWMDTHIGQFGVDQCKQVIKLSESFTKEKSA